MKRILIILGLVTAGLATYAQVDASLTFRKGYEMINKGKYPEAIEHFRKAIEIDSTGDCGTGIKGNAHGELGYAYLRTGDTTNAAIYLDKSIALDPTNAFPRQNKAVLLSMQKKNEEAFRTLAELIQLKPDHTEAYVQRGFLYNADNKRELAINDFKKALELNSRTPVLPANLVNDLTAIIQAHKKR